MKTERMITIAAALLVSAGLAAAEEVVANGGFEAGTGGDSDFWTEFGGGPAGTMSARTSVAPISGNWSHEITAIGDATAGAAAGINYNSVADGGFASLAGGSTVQLSFDARTNFGPGGVGFYALRVLDANGAIVADTGLQNISNGANTSAILNVPALGAFPNDTYAAFVEFVVNAGAFDGSSANALIDNVSVDGTLIPTPGAIAMLGLGGLAAARRRR